MSATSSTTTITTSNIISISITNRQSYIMTLGNWNDQGHIIKRDSLTDNITPRTSCDDKKGSLP